MKECSKYGEEKMTVNFKQKFENLLDITHLDCDGKKRASNWRKNCVFKGFRKKCQKKLNYTLG